MVRKNMITILGLLLITVLISGFALAEKPEKAEPNQTLCPVMGSEINKEVYTDHNGKRIYFCCAGCVSEFKSDPDKYLEKMKAKGVVLEDAPIMQEKCPVSGKPINKEIHIDHDGKRIYFCCNGCKAAFEKSPEKYLKSS